MYEQEGRSLNNHPQRVFLKFLYFKITSLENECVGAIIMLPCYQPQGGAFAY